MVSPNTAWVERQSYYAGFVSGVKGHAPALVCRTFLPPAAHANTHRAVGLGYPGLGGLRFFPGGLGAALARP